MPTEHIATREPSSSVSPWKLGGLSVRQLASRVWAEINEDEVIDRGAALAYYFLFALFPALLFLTALLGLLPIPNLMDRLMEYVSQALPSDAASITQRTLSEILRGAHGGLLSIGVLGALWAASNGIASIMTSLNAVYDVPETRPFWKRKALAIGLTLLFSAFILTALVLMIFGPKLGETVASWVGLGAVFTLVWNVVSIPIVIVLVAIGVALVYYLAPDVEQRFRWVTPGSALAVALWLLMSIGLRWYVAHFANYNATYGSIGGVILLMLWLYLTGIALLVGGEVNAVIEHAAANRGAPDAKAEGDAVPGGAAEAALPANVVRLPLRREARVAASVTEGVARLARLEVELAVSETRRVAVDLGLAFGVAVVAAIILVTGLTVTLAAALAPVFGADWRPLLSAGGGGALLAGLALAWSLYRVRHLGVLRHTLASIKETWQWAERRLKSGTT
jgi:membrane protein